MGNKSCNCNNDHGHDCYHGDNYYFIGEGYGNCSFSASDGRIIGIIILAVGILLIIAEFL